MRGSIACFGEILAVLRCAALVGFRWCWEGFAGFGEEGEVSEWLIPRLWGVSDWT